MTAYEYIRLPYGFPFLRGGCAPATRAHRFLRAAASIATGTRLQSRECLSRPMAFPTDNWLRDDIGLPPLFRDPPTLERWLTPLAPPCFPTDDRLRNDIGLLPLGNGSGTMQA
jgi:hypothetical protein